MSISYRTRVFAVLPTYRRQELLAATLRETAQQTVRPTVVVIVDNEQSDATRAVVESLQDEFCGWDLRYLRAPDNLGSAGGWELGMQSIVDEADDDDWILTLDDDDPPQDRDDLRRILQFACEQRAELPYLAGVGIVGARFNWKTGYLARLSDNQLEDSTPVDYVGSNHMPLYSAAVMKQRGVFRGELFFGHTEVEYCLRLGREGYRFRCHGEMWRERRERANRIGIEVQPSKTCEINWRKYYVTRNYIVMMREWRRWDLAVKRAMIQVIAKPLVTLFVSPRRAWRGFWIAMQASVDGFRKRMGRVVDPGAFKGDAPWSKPAAVRTTTQAIEALAEARNQAFQVGKIWAVIPTWQRPRELEDSLEKLMAQTRCPDSLVIVNNETSAAAKDVVDEFRTSYPEQELIYLESDQNLGSAGGWALGMEHVLPLAADEDWLLTLDDDDPPQRSDELASVHQLAESQLAKDSQLAAVGIVGARFNWKSGQIERVADKELAGLVAVDYVGSGHLAMYSMRALKQAGIIRADLFFGHTEVEFCLRLRRQGYSIVAHGDLWKQRRIAAGRFGIELRPEYVCRLKWQKYYVTRNYIAMMRSFNRVDLALKQALIQIVAKPAITLFYSPITAVRGCGLAVAAVRDGWFGRMGQVIDPAHFSEEVDSQA